MSYALDYPAAATALGPLSFLKSFNLFEFIEIVAIKTF